MIIDPLIIVLGVVLVVALVIGVYLYTRTPKVQRPLISEEPIPPSTEPPPERPAEIPPHRAETEALGLGKRLSRTRAILGEKLAAVLGKSGTMAPTEWEELEEALLLADVGISTTTTLLENVKHRMNGAGASVRNLLAEECVGLLAPLAVPFSFEGPRPLVVSIVGVNGVGKTTTIGKLAQSLRSSGKSVLLGAVDTFRAGAISQLKVWSERTGAEFVTGREGADPGAVAFDAVNAGKSRGLDVILLDTAGRLHTKSNLMDELKKVHRVIKKVIPEAPHETWLVIDGTAGQNSLQQAKEFQKALTLTGLVVTKLDGTAKGGAILAMASELKLPIRYIGVGESAEDFLPFDPRKFVEAILGETN